MLLFLNCMWLICSHKNFVTFGIKISFHQEFIDGKIFEIGFLHQSCNNFLFFDLCHFCDKNVHFQLPFYNIQWYKVVWVFLLYFFVSYILKA